MRRVQKAAAVLAALALTTALAVPVWAAAGSTEITKGADDSAITNNPVSIEVSGTYEMKKVYHVDITWDDMTDFVYNAGTWTPEKENKDDMLQYQDTSKIGWNNNDGNNPKRKITVTNKSNANLAFEFGFEAKNTANKDRINAAFVDVATAGTLDGHGETYTSVTKFWMQRADANVKGTQNATGTSAGQNMGYSATGVASKAEFYFNLTGRPVDTIQQSDGIGTITITVSDADANGISGITVPDTGYDKTYAQQTT